jgi:AcrR family transcriptional regulator
VATWRQQQAAGTRRQIVRAARRLFVASGYAGTTVEAIAAEAGVALATVYKAFGTKAAIARELNALIDEEAATASFNARIAAETSPAELIRLAVALTRSLHERCGDIIATVRSAAAVDATLAGVYAEGTRRHDDGVRWLISKLEAAGPLAPGMTTIQAVGLMSTLCSPEAFADLTTRHGWTAGQCEDWTASALCQLLLSPAANSNAALPADGTGSPGPGTPPPTSPEARAESV